MLKLTGISKAFDGLPVLADLSLTLSQGEIVALIGPSGCGKTTLLNIISGLTAPDKGTVEGAEGRLSYMSRAPGCSPGARWRRTSAWCVRTRPGRRSAPSFPQWDWMALRGIIPASSQGEWPAAARWLGPFTSAGSSS